MREREIIMKLILDIRILHYIIYFFTPDFCSSSYNQCFGGWWEDDEDLAGDNPAITETERPSLANGELTQKLLAIQSSQAEEELSEVHFGPDHRGTAQG